MALRDSEFCPECGAHIGNCPTACPRYEWRGWTNAELRDQLRCIVRGGSVGGGRTEGESIIDELETRDKAQS